MIKMALSSAAVVTNAKLLGSEQRFTGCSIDSRQAQANSLFIALKGERFDGHDFIAQAISQGACAVMSERSGNYNVPILAVRDTRLAMTQLAAHWRRSLSLPVVAITGSNGKTTVKEMLRMILGQHAIVHATKGNFNNDIGVPLTLFGLDEKDRYLVLEMGANHPGEIEKLSRLGRPDVALITQCAPAHLAGFGNLEQIAQSKAEIFAGLSNTGVAVINADDPFADYWQKQCQGKEQLTFSTTKEASVQAINITMDNSGRCSFLLQTKYASLPIKLPLPGRHMVSNALAAAACALALKQPLFIIRQGLCALQAVHGRLVMHAGIAGIRLIDDTYNANPASLQAALDLLAALPDPRWLVLGDMLELGAQAAHYHHEAGVAARAAGVHRLWTVGSLSAEAAQAFGEGANHFNTVAALLEDLRQAVTLPVTVMVKGSRSMHLESVVSGLLVED